MHRPLLAIALLLAPAAADVIVHEESFSLPAAGVERLVVDVPVGEVIVIAGGADAVQVRYALRCDGATRTCRERAAGYHLERGRHGGDLDLEVRSDGSSRRHKGSSPDVLLELTVPAAFAARVELGVGEVEVSGLTGDVDVDLGVGDATVRVPESAVVSVSLDAGVGDVGLRGAREATRSRGFVGRELSWREGRGNSRVTVDVGVGDARVELER